MWATGLLLLCGIPLCLSTWGHPGGYFGYPVRYPKYPVSNSRSTAVRQRNRAQFARNYYQRNSHLLFGLPVSPACRGHLPCYDVTLNLITDGPFKPLEVKREGDILLIYSYRHFNRKQVIAEGRKAAAFFKKRFGVDFTYLHDNAFLTGKVQNTEGVIFRPFTVDLAGRYRLYSATTKSKTQLFNRPINEAGWLVTFTKEFRSKGTLKKVIPAGAFAVFGTYIVFPCDSSPKGNFQHIKRACYNILNPGNHRAPIVLSVYTANYLREISEPSPFTYIDCIFYNKVWGRGRGRGYFASRESDRNTIDGRVAITFPSFQ